MSYIHQRKILLCVVALATFVASVALTFGAPGYQKQGYMLAPQSITSVSDFYTQGQDPWGTAFDSSGNVWVALPGCDPSPMCGTGMPPGKIGEFNPNTNNWITTYTLPSNFAQPLFLAFDSKGRAWFPMPMNNSIGMFNPANSSFQQWTVPTASSGPWGVAIDSKDRVWFTEHYGYKIGMFDPTKQTFKEIATPSQSSVPYGIVVDTKNNVWFTENSDTVALIGEYTAAGVLKEYKIRTTSTSGLTPHLITVDPKGNIWWSEGWVGMIGKLKVALAKPGTNAGVSEYSYQQLCSGCGTHTSGISAHRYGNIWFDDSLQSTFGSFPMSGVGSASMHTTPTSNSHPHDGMHVDAKNRIWFDEEFANKLALVTQSASGPPSPTATQPVTSTLAIDTFQRPNQAFWGKASDGNTWAGGANRVNAFSIVNNSGQVTATGTNSYNAILGPTATNAAVVFSGSITNFSNANVGAVLRWTDANNWYGASLDGAHLMLQKDVNGTVATLTSVAFAAKANTSYSLRFLVTGTTLKARVWATGSTEPTTWLLTSTDTALTAGRGGLTMLTQNATLTITAFKVLAE